MELTNAQRATLRAAILAEPSLQSAVSAGDDVQVAAWCNLASTYVVWRSAVSTREMLEVVTWTEVDALSVGKARIFEWMLRLPSIDGGVAKVRSGLSDAFGASSTTYQSILPVLKRFATRAEAFLANGTGTDASPARLRAEGTVSTDDVALILRG